MAVLIAIAERSLLALGILLLILQMLAHEVGYWLGCRQQRKSDGRSEGGFNWSSQHDLVGHPVRPKTDRALPHL
jgi:hypothetical protein